MNARSDEDGDGSRLTNVGDLEESLENVAPAHFDEGEEFPGALENADLHMSWRWRAWMLLGVDPSLMRVYREASSRDLQMGRVRWTRSWRTDAWFYLCNNNFPLSLFLVHENNPYGLWQRWVVMFCSLSVAFLLTAIGALLPWGLTGLWGFVIAPIILFVWNNYVGLIATCRCIYSSWCPVGLQSSLATIARVFLGFCVVMAACSILVGRALLHMAYDRNEEYKWISSWILTQLSSFAWSLPADLILFAIYRHMEEPKPLRNMPQSSV